jgi:hypothetical protein
MKTTEEKNRMIAEFMGGEFEKMHFNGVEQEVVTLINCHQIKMSQLMSVYTSNLLFHTSWDWLMPVVEKIETELKYEVLIGRIYSQVNIIGDEDNTISKWVCGDPKKKLEITYETICQFIEWYNENK